MIKKIEQGGLKLMDFESKVKALKVAWINRLCTDNEVRWKAAAMYFFQTKNFDYYFKCNQGPLKLKSMFYQMIQNVWSELTEAKDPDFPTVCNQVLWNNRYITVNNKPLKWKNWYKQGILKVADILNDKGDVLTHEEINRKYQVNCNFLNAMQIRQSIPYAWRIIIKNKAEYTNIDTDDINIDGTFYSLMNLKTKIVYDVLLKKKFQEPVSVKGWIKDFPNFTEADPELWHNIYKLPFKTTRETKLQSLQFKIVHRIIVCKTKLCQ